MCSSGNATEAELNQAQAAMTNTLNADYSTTFAEQQSVLGQLTAKLNYVASNPMGLAPQQMATAITGINENTATAVKQAVGSAAAFGATHGGADTGSGPIGEIAGQIGSAGAESKAQSLASLSNLNQETKQKNFWNAISGLSSVGSEYGGASGTAIGGSSSVANSSTDAANSLLASQQAGWQDVGGVMSGIAGLGTAAGAIGKGFNLGG